MSAIRCPICGEALAVRLARGRKSGKPFVMLLCPTDGRHARLFINHQPYVREVLARLEGKNQETAQRALDDAKDVSPTPGCSRTNLERGGAP